MIIILNYVLRYILKRTCCLRWRVATLDLTLNSVLLLTITICQPNLQGCSMHFNKAFCWLHVTTNITIITMPSREKNEIQEFIFSFYSFVIKLLLKIERSWKCRRLSQEATLTAFHSAATQWWLYLWPSLFQVRLRTSLSWDTIRHQMTM